MKRGSGESSLFTPPIGNALEFALSVYTAPSGDELLFDFISVAIEFIPDIIFIF